MLADRTTIGTMTGFYPEKLINGHLPLMPTEESVTMWRTVGWRDGVSREELLQRRIKLFS